jgi:hypothetical protein
MEKRTYKRFATGSFCDMDCAIADKVKIKDISIGGICLETSRRISAKSIYDMKIIIRKNEGEELKGKVIWSTLSRSIKDKIDIIPIYDIGLKFVEQNSNKNKFLKKITEKLDH